MMVVVVVWVVAWAHASALKMEATPIRPTLIGEEKMLVPAVYRSVDEAATSVQLMP